ncbi:MAG: radical SAM family heme chaperone HemW, partial [Alphaproteobacteria bacterium]|jgi:oxygen-independent coproporphyrinogen-3 oxidase
MMGLRLVEGVDLARFETIVGSPVEHFVDAAGLHRLIDGGFVTLDRSRLAATPAGLQRLNAVLPVLLRD